MVILSLRVYVFILFVVINFQGQVILGHLGDRNKMFPIYREKQPVVIWNKIKLQAYCLVKNSCSVEP